MTHDGYAEQVARDARLHAIAELLRRRPDLKAKSPKTVKVPPDEQAQFDLDRLAYTRAAADRIAADITVLVLDARRHSASWTRVGLALQESGQTAFNRYRKLEGERSPPPQARSATRKCAPS